LPFTSWWLKQFQWRCTSDEALLEGNVDKLFPLGTVLEDCTLLSMIAPFFDLHVDPVIAAK
jgi:hypothetical protein